MGEETAIGMARAVAAWGGASGALILQRLPGERRAIESTLFLPPSGQWTARSTPVRGIFAADVAEPHTAWNWAPRHRKTEVITGAQGGRI